MRHSLCSGVSSTKRQKDLKSVLTLLQNQEGTAWVPGICPHEMLNRRGKGVARGKVEREKAFLFWREMREMLELPVHIVEMPVNETLLDLALKHNLALYDASYLSLALLRKLPIATANGKLKEAGESVGLDIIEP